MSELKIQQPVIHIPTFKEYRISYADLARKYKVLGIDMPFPRSDNWYYHSDVEGWAKIIPNLVFKSNLYRPERFDCEDYALKSQTICAERFGLNTLRYTYGNMPLGPHGFNSFWNGDAIMLLEPNEGFWGYLGGDVVFAIGENGYIPQAVLI